MRESELRAQVVSLAHSRGWMVFSLPIAKTRRPVKDAVGYPDLTLARHGAVLWLELKQDAGLVSDAQVRWMSHLPAHACHVIRPVDVVSGVLDGLLA